MPEPIPVFLNDRAHHVAAGATLAQLLAASDAGLLDALDRGQASASDGRGIPLDRDAVLVAGAIVRVIRTARRPHESPDA